MAHPVSCFNPNSFTSPVQLCSQKSLRPKAGRSLRLNRETGNSRNEPNRVYFLLLMDFHCRSLLPYCSPRGQVAPRSVLEVLVPPPPSSSLNPHLLPNGTTGFFPTRQSSFLAFPPSICRVQGDKYISAATRSPRTGPDNGI